LVILLLFLGIADITDGRPVKATLAFLAVALNVTALYLTARRSRPPRE
jgi:hypothetical protein